jgi:hypothetical protein
MLTSWREGISSLMVALFLMKFSRRMHLFFFCMLWLLRSGLLGVSRGAYFHPAGLIYFLPNLVMSSLIAIVGKREGQGFL